MEELVTQAWFLEHMGAPDLVQLQANTAVWTQALATMPTEQLVPMFYAAVQVCTETPRPGDVLKAWRAHLAAQPNKSFQELESERLQSLPMSTEDGPGRKAWLAMGKRRVAVVCKCGDSPAVLTDDSLLWVCRTGDCDFTWSVAMTETAPMPKKSGPLAEQVGQEVVKPLVVTPQHSPALQMFADDAGVDLEACSPQQFVEFRLFMNWWREAYPHTKVNPVLMVEQYPKFQRQRPRGMVN